MVLETGERIDDLGREGLQIIQQANAFCFGMDAVLLAHFAAQRAAHAVLDLGTGNGILLLLLWARTKAERLCGIEIQPAAAALAARNIVHNGLSDRISVIMGDYTAMPPPQAPFDLVVANPPYQHKNAGASPNMAQRIARTEQCATLIQTVETAAAQLCEGGRFCVVYRPHRYQELCDACVAAGLSLARTRMVVPRTDKPPSLCLLEAVKRGKQPHEVLPPLLLQEENGAQSAEIESIYNQ